MRLGPLQHSTRMRTYKQIEELKKEERLVNDKIKQNRKK